MADVDPRGPQGEGPRYQPEFSAGERLARLEALYEAFRRTEIEWQEQPNRRFDASEKEIILQREERATEVESMRREFTAAAEATDKAINKAGEAQEKQNTLTREEAQRARESVEARLLSLERGESQGAGSRQAYGQSVTTIIALIAAFAGIAIAVSAIIHG